MAHGSCCYFSHHNGPVGPVTGSIFINSICVTNNLNTSSGNYITASNIIASNKFITCSNINIAGNIICITSNVNTSGINIDTSNINASCNNNN